MKHTMNEIDGVRAVATTPAHEPRYQIYRQARAGNFMPELKTDSAREAVEIFIIMAPAFDCGAIRLWDHYGQHVAASVEWRPDTTDFGFAVYRRTNLFHDRLLGLVAWQVQEKATMRESLRHEAGLSLAV